MSIQRTRRRSFPNRKALKRKDDLRFVGIVWLDNGSNDIRLELTDIDRTVNLFLTKTSDADFIYERFVTYCRENDVTKPFILDQLDVWEREIK